MLTLLTRARGAFWPWFVALLLPLSLVGQEPASEPMPYDADSAALQLAKRYLEGGPGAKEALIEALSRMGWSVRDAKGAVVHAPPAGADTGLAMRDYELEELLWKPAEQPAIRFISLAQAFAVPFEDADPEEIAHDLSESLRKGAESTQPQQRFWARFIVALSRVSPAGTDLLGAPPPPTIPPTKAMIKQIEKEAKKNPFAAMKLMQPTPVWPVDDPVLAPSKRPKRTEGDARGSPAERDQKRLQELQEEMGKLSQSYGQGGPEAQKAAQAKMMALTTEMSAITQRITAATMSQVGAAMKKMNGGEEKEEDEDDNSSGPRFLAEWRDEPLSLLQVALLTRVFAADLKLAVFKRSNLPGYSNNAAPFRAGSALPFAMLGSVQVPGGPPTTFGGQFAGAAGDIWATGWGAYTGAVLEHNLPGNKFSKGVGIANVIIAWFKTIMSVARQNITVEVENVPLIRTKTRTPGEQRVARAKVAIDFPKSDALKAIRAAGNLATIDLQLPDGGPVGGAKVVWRLPEGSFNNKYQTGKGGGWEYKPELAVVEFAHVNGGTETYTSYTNDDGEATITIEGTAQRRLLPPNVRPYPRRAAIAVEVTIKVGNITQDFNDAINTAMGGVVSGGLSFIADMVLRTSFFFQKGKAFEVTDWKEPAWEGEFSITVKGSGSKHEKGEKGGPDMDHAWSMNRYMEGRLHTPEWEEENEQEKDYKNDGRHHLEVDGDSRMFKLTDSSSSKTKNSNNRYEANGPLQIQPPGRNQLELFSRAEPSGSAELVFNGGKMMLELRPFFGAQCMVSRSESARGRTVPHSGPEYLSLLNGVYPDTFTIIEDNDGSGDYIEGEKTYDNMGTLPYVPSFDIKVVVKYRLWKNGPPPKNKQR